MSFSPDEIATAYHEAGHAVMALLLGRPVQRVSIEPNHLRLGHCAIRKGTVRPSSDPLETEILFILGGPAAEARHSGDYHWGAAAQDLRSVRALIKQRAPGEKQAERLEQRLLAKAEHILDRSGVWSAVERIVAELLRCNTISGRAARHFFEEATAKQ